MSALLEKKDIINIAVRIEDNGERFYREAAEKVKSPEVKELLTILAKDETRHKTVFLNLVKNLSLSNELLSDEYMNYLKAYTDRLIFQGNPDDFSEQMKKFDQLWVLDYAIQRELDSILYYYELKNIVTTQDIKLIDEIISEERNHFEKLSKIKSIIISK